MLYRGKALISLSSIVALGEMDYVRPYKENYKNKAICDWSAGYPVVHEEEALLLSKREIMDRSILDRAEHECE